MFESLVSLLATLNSLSPLAVIALLALVLFYQAKNEKNLHTLRTNDLHEFPDVIEALRRIEVSMEKNFSTIIAKLNGGKH